MTYLTSHEIDYIQLGKKKEKTKKVTSTKEYYTLKTYEKLDSIRMTLTLDSTRNIGFPNKWKRTNAKPYEEIGTGRSLDDKEIRMDGKRWPKWPSRKVWEQQENLPRGKYKPGEKYTYYKPDYYNGDGADTIVYLFKEVKDSIALFEVIPRDVIRRDINVHMTGHLEYDLKSDHYTKSVNNEHTESTIEIGEVSQTIIKDKKSEYTITLEE